MVVSKMGCDQEMCPFWGGSGCICEVVDIGAHDRRLAREASEGWAAYAAEQERHAETARRLEEMSREARLSREATEKAVQSRVARHELERAFRAVDTYDAVASDEDVTFHNGAAHAVRIMREMLGYGGLHPCAKCGLELDSDDPNRRCGDCADA